FAEGCFKGDQRSRRRTEHAEEREGLAVLDEGLQQHQQHTRAAPGKFRENAKNVLCAWRSHLAGSRPFRKGWRRGGGQAASGRIGLSGARNGGWECRLLRERTVHLFENSPARYGKAAREKGR